MEVDGNSSKYIMGEEEEDMLKRKQEERRKAELKMEEDRKRQTALEEAKKREKRAKEGTSRKERERQEKEAWAGRAGGYQRDVGGGGFGEVRRLEREMNGTEQVGVVEVEKVEVEKVENIRVEELGKSVNRTSAEVENQIDTM